MTPRYGLDVDKKTVINELQSHIAHELADLVKEAESKSQSLDERAEALRRQLLMYKFLPQRDFTPEDVICPAGLVELEINGIHSYYFIVPSGGGLVTRIDGQAVQVITPQSPLGEVLLGKKVGESVQVMAGGKPRKYRIIGFS